MAEFLAAMAAIPEMIKLCREMFKFMKDTFGDNPAKFIRDSHVAFKDLNAAKTSEQKIEAAKKIQDLIQRL